MIKGHITSKNQLHQPGSLQGDATELGPIIMIII